MAIQQSNAPRGLCRREFLQVSTGFLIAALWEIEIASAEEMKMAESKKSDAMPSVLSYEDVRAVSPALEHYTKGPLLGGLWKRPELSLRDRSVVTVAALIARIQTIEMSFHFSLALDNGLIPAELSEIVTHLAFYSTANYTFVPTREPRPASMKPRRHRRLVASTQPHQQGRQLRTRTWCRQRRYRCCSAE